MFSKFDLVQKEIRKDYLKEFIDFDNKVFFEEADFPTEQAPPPLKIADMEQALNRGDNIFGLFNKDDKLVAYYWLEFRSKENLLYIGTIAIQKDYHGKGVGEKIFEIIEGIACENKFQRLALAVDPLNGRAVRFYLKYGYLITDFKRAYFGEESPNTHRLWMEKSLDRIYSFGEMEERVYCVDNNAIEKAINDGLTGVRLERDLNNDNHKNLIVFQRKIN